jgi:hypothetical protein
VTVLRARSLRLRLWWTTLLVLIALGGAGLAVAADRPQNPVQRPELTWRADHAAEPWIKAVADELRSVEADVTDLSEEGRAVLGELQALDLERMRASITAGDTTSTDMEAAIQRLQGVHNDALAEIDEWRLGPATSAVLEQLNTALASANLVSGYWHGLTTEANRVAGLVDAFLRHDGLVFRATTAGRQSNWDDALAFLDQATGPLTQAASVRDALAPTVDVSTLDDLIDRYRAYDGALTAVYTYLRDGGRQQGLEFDSLQAAVDQAQAALPGDTTAMSVIVSDAAGPSVTDALVAIESAHGDILAALSAVDDAYGALPGATPSPRSTLPSMLRP